MTDTQKTQNITLEQQDIQIFVQFKNKTAPSLSRKKRNAELHEDNSNVNDDNIKKARDIVLNHNVPCNKENTNEICKQLVHKLKSIYANNEQNLENYVIQDHTKEREDKNFNLKESTPEHDRDSSSTDISKRHTHSVISNDMLRSTQNVPLKGKASYGYENLMYPAIAYPDAASSSHLTDTCLLARLLKERYPNAEGKNRFFIL